jgi:hypothetical protein
MELAGYLTCYLMALRCLESNYLPIAIFRVYNDVPELLHPHLSRDVCHEMRMYVTIRQ